MNMEITKYFMIVAIDSWGLNEEVNEYIKQGWVPFGSPFGQGTHLYQAVVKYSAYC